MKKIFCLLLLSVIITTPSFAEQVTSLVLELADGTRSTFLFSETPVITIPDDNVNISCATSNISYNRQNIKKMYFEQTETAIKNIKIDESNVTFCFQDREHIKVSGLASGESVCVYNLSGLLLSSHKASSSGNATIPLTENKERMYIIKCGNKSFKVNSK